MTLILPLVCYDIDKGDKVQRKLQILSGRSHPAIAKNIAQELGIGLCEVSFSDFANGEVKTRILQSVRGNDVFIVQSHCGSVNDSIMEQAIMIDAAKRASAGNITAVCPFFAYARQDRKAVGREPISARLLVDILANAGADRVMSIDLHTGQIQGFMDGPFDHLIARPVLINYLLENFSKSELVIVSPDAGRVKSSERYSNILGSKIAIVHKHRSAFSKNEVRARHLIGDVKGKTCVLVDDMIDTAGTLCEAAELVMSHGAKEVYGLATHGLFSPPAKDRIARSKLKKVIVTDTLPQKNFDKKVVLSVAPILAGAINAIHSGGSVSALFDGDNQF